MLKGIPIIVLSLEPRAPGLDEPIPVLPSIRVDPPGLNGCDITLLDEPELGVD